MSMQDFFDHLIDGMIDSDKLTDRVRTILQAADIKIDADNVAGLEDFVNSAIGDAKIDADNVDDLEDFVNSAIGGGKIEADNVDGLEDKIQAGVTEMLEKDTIHVDSVDGLDDFVDD